MWHLHFSALGSVLHEEQGPYLERVLTAGRLWMANVSP